MSQEQNESVVAVTPKTLSAAVRQGIDDLDKFFFAPILPTTLGLIRLLAGLAIFYIHFCYTFNLPNVVGQYAWFDQERIISFRENDKFWVPSTDSWSDPVDPISRPQYTFSVFFHVMDPVGMWVVHFGFLAVTLMFALGLWTRYTSVLTWIATLSYIQRSPYSLFGMDTMSTILVTYMMLAPCDKAFALDSFLERMRRKREGDPNWDAPPAPSSWANFITRCIQFHFCIVYLAAGASKLLGSSWWNGTALWLVFSNNEFTPMDNPLYFQTLKFLSNHRVLWELSMTSFAVYTLLLELALPFLIWYPRWRWVMMSGSFLLHLGIGIFMGLKVFSILMVLFVSSFMPPEVTEWIRQQWSRSLGLARTGSTPKLVAKKVQTAVA